MHRDAIEYFKQLPLLAARTREAAAPEASHIQVRALGTLSEFCSLAHDWDRLQSEAAATSVFNTWMWHLAWWQLHGAGRALKVMLARRAGVTTGIVPLYVDTVRAMGVKVRVLRLLGADATRNAHNIGPLFERGSEQLTAPILAKAILGMRGYDLLELPELDAAIPLAAAIADAARAVGMRYHVEQTKRLVHLPLAPNWNAYLRSLSSPQRARIRHRRRALHAAHTARFFVWQAGAALDAPLALLAELAAKRGAAAASSPLQRSAMAEAFADGRLRLYCLELDGRVRAAACGLRFRDRIVLTETQFDPQYASSRPLSVLLHYAVEHAIGEGVAGFDFLQNDPALDDDLAFSRQLVRVSVFRSTLPAAAFRAREALSRRRARPQAPWAPATQVSAA
jgi:CelD/BcsL family acetyltransferase involved in cellulose biosynthesis